jgi:hypothetical protein
VLGEDELEELIIAPSYPDEFMALIFAFLPLSDLMK